MRVAFLADCHGDHGKHRLWAFGAWARATAEIAAGGYDAAIVGGDLFDTGRPIPEAVIRCEEGLRTMTDAGVRVVVLAGNHEWIGVRAAAGHRPPTLMLADPPRVTAVVHPEGLRVSDDLWVAALPWPAPGSELTQRDAALRLADEACGVDAATLAVGHAAVAEAAPWAGSESELTVAPAAATAALADLDIPEAFTRTMLGHIHNRRSLSATCGYVGSLECFTFADEGRRGGWSSLELVDGAWVETFVEAGEFRFETIDMDTDLSTLQEGTLVRVRVRPGESRLDFDTQQLRTAGLRFVDWYDETAAAAAAERAGAAVAALPVSEPLDTVALLQKWAERRQLTAKEQRLLLDAAARELGWAAAAA